MLFARDGHRTTGLKNPPRLNISHNALSQSFKNDMRDNSVKVRFTSPNLKRKGYMQSLCDNQNKVKYEMEERTSNCYTAQNPESPNKELPDEVFSLIP